MSSTAKVLGCFECRQFGCPASHTLSSDANFDPSSAIHGHLESDTMALHRAASIEIVTKICKALEWKDAASSEFRDVDQLLMLCQHASYTPLDGSATHSPS